MKIMSLIILISFTLVGCANFNSIHRDLDVDAGTGALIDIKQRALFVSKHVTTNGTIKTEKTIVCAEPSPDSLSAFAAELAAESGSSKKLAAAFQESSSFVGLRTQSIQLLRDSLYRLCEGYMSGALSEANYEMLTRRYQKYMVALLAIEQLTGTVQVPVITINTEGSADAAQSLSSLRNEISKIDSKITAIEDDTKLQNTKKKEDGVTEEQKKDIDKNIASNDTKLSALKSDKETISKAIENAKGLAVSGKTTASVDIRGLQSKRSDAHIQAVSGTVEKIVTRILSTDDTGQLCWSYLNQNPNVQTALAKSCAGYINNKNKEHEIFLKAQEKLLGANNNNDADKFKEILKKFKENKNDGWDIKSIPVN